MECFINKFLIASCFKHKMCIRDRLDSWYEKDMYATTSDGGDAYTKDDDFLKSCLLYTCLSNQNKCLSFLGSDGHMYQNELCLDNSRYEKAKEKVTQDGKEACLSYTSPSGIPQLPATGGAGTIAFTVAGCTVAFAGVMIATRKNKKDDENK